MVVKASSEKDRRPRESLVDVLLRRGDVPDEPLDKARALAESTNRRLELVLISEKLVSDCEVALATAEYLQMPAVSLAHFTPDAELLSTLPRRMISDLHVLPIAKWGSVLAVAVGDPFDVPLMDEIDTMVEEEVVSYVAPAGQIDNILKQFSYLWDDGLAEALRDVDQVNPDVSVSTEKVAGEVPTQEEMVSLGAQEPVIRIVNSMLIEALERRVSDIHIEPMEHVLCVRYRIDGVLYDQPSPPKYMQWAIVSRLKIVAKLDIAQRRLPQDGRFSIRAAGRNADVRVSMVPTVHGQKVVLRILDKGNLMPDVGALGLEQKDLDLLERAIRQPEGLILVTGPTGSGKTTTLYSILGELNEPGVNIITVEDPVEYQLSRINQIPANPEIGLTFAAGLRSILRQDPDIIMVGEIRDVETASIAVQASLTGHLVLSTLHTNDASGAVARLVHMGVEPFLIASSLLLSQAQRIYRKLCPQCRRPVQVDPELLAANGLSEGVFEAGRLQGPVGCPRCSGIGYAGRRVLMELLPNNREIRERILRRASTEEIRDQARAAGMQTLREAGLRRVLEGDTSLEEVLRVTGSA